MINISKYIISTKFSNTRIDVKIFLGLQDETFCVYCIFCIHVRMFVW